MANRTGKGCFKPGHKKLGGIKKGDKHKFTSLKQSFLDAFIAMDKDQRTSLKNFAKHPLNQKDFLKMVASMLPKEMTLKGDADSPLVIQFGKADEKL